MRKAPAARGAHVARMACLLAVAPPVGVFLLVVGGQSPSPWFVGLVAIVIATTLRAAIVLPRGGGAVFVLLWTAFGVSLGVTLLGAFSVGLVFLMTDAMLVLAIASAPNRTARSRADPRYLAVQAVAFFATIAIPFVLI